ncbi:MAG TPA: hypothetical protein V6D22_07195 [Candidatus Obscuribacterales bacterium]
MAQATAIEDQVRTGEFRVLADMIIASANPGLPPEGKETAPSTDSETAVQLLDHLRQTAAKQEDTVQLTAQYFLDNYFDVQPTNLTECVLAPIPPEPHLETHAAAPGDARKAIEAEAAAVEAWITDSVRSFKRSYTAPAATPRIDRPLVQNSQPAQTSHRPVQQTAPRLPHLPGQFVKFGPYELRPAYGYELAFGRDYQPLPHTSISRLAGFVGIDEYSLYIREVPDDPQSGLRPSRNGIWVKQPTDLAFRRLQPGEAERITPETLIRVGGDGQQAETGLAVEVLV